MSEAATDDRGAKTSGLPNGEIGDRDKALFDTRASTSVPDEVAECGGESAYALEVGHEVGLHLGEMLRGYDADALVTDLGPPEVLAGRLLRAVPTPSPWNDAIGPFYDSRQMAAVLGGISRQALAERRQRRTVLALRTADRVFVYPTFQVAVHGAILPGLGEILKAFDPAVVDGWSVAGWLVATQRLLDGLTPIAWLSAKRDQETLIALAEDANQRFVA